MANQVLRTTATINFPNTVPGGIVDDDITWVTLHNSATPAAGTAYIKIDVSDVNDLVLGSTIRLPSGMVMLTYPNDSVDTETELMGQSVLHHLNTTGFYAVIHEGDPGSEAQGFLENQITEPGVATVPSGSLEVVDA